MEKQMNVPELRFPGFDGGWEKTKLIDITTLITKGTTPSYFTDSGINFVKLECFNEDNINAKKCLFVDEQTHNRLLKRSVLKENDILFAIAGATIGKCNIVAKEILPANTNQALAIIRLKEDENKLFIYYILKSYKMHRYIIDNVAGGAQPNMNLEQLGKFSFSLPTLPEQQKIASFLTAVDEKLQALKKKKTLLAKYKKGVMQKIFSQQLRFKDEDGKEFEEWGVKKLGEVGKFFSGGTPLTSKRHYFNGKIPFIRSGEINSNKTEQFISEEGFKNSSAKMVEVGDLIYALYGATSGEVGISKIKGAINQAILCIRTEMDNRFLNNYFLLNKDNIINTYLQGGQGNLSAEIIKSLEVPVPSLPEQIKIANFLSSIDEKLKQIQTQIDKTGQWKKGLLQKMFC